jgi:hypothetical protein
MAHGLDDLKRLYGIRELLGIPTRKKTIVCPLPMHSHKHNTPSFSIFMGRDGVEQWKCHGNCGMRGDVIDLAGFMWVPGYNPHDGKKIMQAATVLQTRGELTFPTPEIDRTPQLSATRHKAYLPIGKEAREYCYSRGLNDQTIGKFLLGQDRSYLTIPSFYEGRLMGIKKRAINEHAYLRYHGESGSKQSLFNSDRVAFGTGLVILTKGEIPVMILDQMGYKACAPTGGEGSWLQEWNTPLMTMDVLVIGDNDLAGKKYFTQRATTLGGIIKFPPERYKDLDEWILAEPGVSRQKLEEWANEFI